MLSGGLSNATPLQLGGKVVPAQAIRTFHNWSLSICRAGETQSGKTGNFLVFAGFVHAITCSVRPAEGNLNGLFSRSTFPWCGCQLPPDRI